MNVARARAALSLLAGFAFGLAQLGCGRVLGIPDAEKRAESPEVSGGSCTSHAECLKGSSEVEPRICVQGRCTELLHPPECPVAYPQDPALRLETLSSTTVEPLVAGAFLPVRPTSYGPPNRSLDLALTEIATALGSASHAEGARPIVTVVCDAAPETTDVLDRAIDHLVDTLEVPAVLAALASSDLEYAFARASDHHTFFLSTEPAGPAPPNVSHDGLLWHLLPSLETLGPAYAPLLDRTTRHLRRTGVLGSEERARVALVEIEADRGLSALADAAVEAIGRDGNGVEQDPPELEEFILPAGADPALMNLSIRSFAPHVIMAFSSDAFLTDTLRDLEIRPEVPPFYLLSPLHTHSPVFTAQYGVRTYPNLSLRMLGIHHALPEDTSAHEAFLTRFGSANPVHEGTLGLERYYDAAYFLYYAALAPGSSEGTTGPDFALGMRRLLEGPSFKVGPDDLLTASSVIADGRTITLNGLLGVPDFDPESGARRGSASAWCVDWRGLVHTDVLRLDSKGELVGTVPCFEFDRPCQPPVGGSVPPEFLAAVARYCHTEPVVESHCRPGDRYYHGRFLEPGEPNGTGPRDAPQSSNLDCILPRIAEVPPCWQQDAAEYDCQADLTFLCTGDGGWGSAESCNDLDQWPCECAP
jgi:hypothetical protein